MCFETFAALGIVMLELWPVVGLELWPALTISSGSAPVADARFLSPGGCFMSMIAEHRCKNVSTFLYASWNTCPGRHVGAAAYEITLE